MSDDWDADYLSKQVDELTIERDQLRAVLLAVKKALDHRLWYGRESYKHEVSMGRTWENDGGANMIYCELQALERLAVELAPYFDLLK